MLKKKTILQLILLVNIMFIVAHCKFGYGKRGGHHYGKSKYGDPYVCRPDKCKSKCCIQNRT